MVERRRAELAAASGEVVVEESDDSGRNGRRHGRSRKAAEASIKTKPAKRGKRESDEAGRDMRRSLLALCQEERLRIGRRQDKPGEWYERRALRGGSGLGLVLKELEVAKSWRQTPALLAESLDLC